MNDRALIDGSPGDLYDPQEIGGYVLTDTGTQTEECARTCAPGMPADCDDNGCACPHHTTTN